MEKEKKIWFTSDTHFNHDKPFVWQVRGYNNVQEMNKDIVTKWNQLVNDEDEVYHLGDVMLGENELGLDYIKQLKGKIHIILGNHDTDVRKVLYEQLSNIVEVTYATMIKYKKWHFFLSHYPTIMGSWGDQKKLWNLSGHTHSNLKFENGQYKSYNVGLDAHNNCLIEISQILTDIQNYNNQKDKEL